MRGPPPVLPPVSIRTSLPGCEANDLRALWHARNAVSNLDPFRRGSASAIETATETSAGGVMPVEAAIMRMSRVGLRASTRRMEPRRAIRRKPEDSPAHKSLRPAEARRSRNMRVGIAPPDRARQTRCAAGGKCIRPSRAREARACTPLRHASEADRRGNSGRSRGKTAGPAKQAPPHRSPRFLPGEITWRRCRSSRTPSCGVRSSCGRATPAGPRLRGLPCA